MSQASLPPLTPSRWQAFLALAGSLPLVSIWWVYKLFIVMNSQAGATRTLGVFEVLGVGMLLLAGLAALVLPRRLVPAHALAVLLFGLTLLNFTLLGLTIFFLTPRFAPKGLLVVLAIAVVALLVRFMRYDSPTQRLAGRALVGAGLACYLLLFATLPWVVADAWQDTPHLPISPLPPRGLAVRRDAPKRVVLITFDALRYRSTSFAEPKRDNTPALGALGRESTVFTNARAASDNTLVSMPTVLTGIRPSDYFPHVGTISVYLRDGFLTGLAGFLAPAGYRAYYATMLVNPLTFGLDSEFVAGRETSGIFRRNQFNTRSYLPLPAILEWTRSKLTGHWEDDADLDEDEIPATRETFQLGLDYLAHAEGKSFLWLHIGVPHTPYHVIPRAQASDPGDPRQYPQIQERDVAAADPATLLRYQQIYEDYTHFGDAELGRFLAGLKAAKLYDDTLIVITGDHGEDFEQPGHIPHGNGIATEDVAHVPLLFHLAGQHLGQRLDGLAGHRGIVPTVLAQVYQAPVPGLTAHSLLEQPLDPDRYAYTWAMSTRYIPQLKQAQTIAAYTHQYKYLVRYPTREESLYDLSKDPRARTNIASQLPAVLVDMRTHLARELHP